MNYLVYQQLKRVLKRNYFKEVGNGNGEMFYGFYFGCVIVLVFLGVELLEVMDYVGWI